MSENNDNNTLTSPAAKELSPVRMALRLTAIVAVIICMLSAVNYYTKDIIAENERLEGQNARDALFNGAEFTELDISALTGQQWENVSAVYRAEINGTTAGYCVDIYASGFSSDPMLLTVGITADTVSVKGIRTITHSETSGIGSKVVDNEGEFLQRFDGRTNTTVDDVAAVSGATISSGAVKQAVKTALSAARTVAGGGQNG